MQENSTKLLPQGMNFIYLTQALWNFGFYGIKSIFVIYSIRQLSLSESNAIALFATFMSLCYATSLIGGTIADRFVGVKNSVTLGILLSFSGLVCFFYSSQESWFVGLALMSLGSGFVKPNLQTSIGLLFENSKDPLKDRAYSLYYAAMNAGSFLTPIVSGFLCVKYGWNYGILFIALGFLVATFYFNRNVHFVDKKEQDITVSPFAIVLLTLFCLLIISLFYVLYKYKESMHGLMGLISIASILYLARIFSQCSTQERKDVFHILICILLFAFFCSLYEQAGSSLMLFFEKTVDRNFMGIVIPSSAFLSLDPLFVLILVPTFLYFSKTYFEKMKPLDEFFKIGLGFMCASGGFLILALSTYQNIFPISPWWVVTAILIKTMGEILFVPTVLSTISKYAPIRFRSVMMSFWLMSIAYGHYIAGMIAQFSLRSSADISVGMFDQYFPFFTTLCLLALGVGVLLLCYQGMKKLRH